MPVLDAPAGKPTFERVASLDVFRGLTMTVMIFVNEVAEIHGLPWWTYHAHAQENRMTYVDMVFPFFLFIVGMAMPLAVKRRLELDGSQGALWLHIALRAAGLIVLGLILANAQKADPARMGLSGASWGLLGLTGAILFWVVPGRNPRLKLLFRALRVMGLLLLVGAFVIFRRSAAGGEAWIDGSYPEILGLIGYAYLSTSLLYLPTRRRLWAPLAWFLALTALCALGSAHLLNFYERLPLYVWPFGSGASASIVMGGVVTSIIFMGSHRWQRLRDKMMLAGGFGGTCLVVALALVPLGVSKIRATPSWCLASVGASVFTFMLLYWVCDVRGKTQWAALVKPAGQNTLLTYLLPDIYYYLAALAGVTLLETHFQAGWAGVMKSAIFTLAILGVSRLLTRCRIRLQL